MTKQPRRISLASQAFWLLFAKTLAFGFTFLLPLLLVRVLSQDVLGQYRQIFLLVTTSGSVLPLGMTMTAFYFFPREKNRHREIVANIVLFYFFVAAAPMLLLLVHPRSIVWFLGQESLTSYARATGVMLFFYIFSSPIEMIATAYQDVQSSSIFIVCASLTKTLLTLTFVMLAPSLEAVIASVIVQGVLQTAVLHWYLQSRFPRFWTTFDWTLFKTQFRYALPLGISSVLWIVQRDLHAFFVSREFGSAAFAVYSYGCLQIPLLNLVRESVSSVLISKTSEFQQNNMRSEIVQLNARAMRKLALVFWPAMFFLLVMAEEFIVLLFTERFRASVPIFRINLLLLPLMIPTTDPIVRAFAEYRYYVARVRFVQLLILTTALYFGTRMFGMAGAIGSVLAVSAIEQIVVCSKSVRILGITRADWHFFKGTLNCGLAALGAAVFTYIIREWMTGSSPVVSLISCGLTYVAIYAAILVTARFLEDDEKLMAAAVVTRIRHAVPLAF